VGRAEQAGDLAAVIAASMPFALYQRAGLAVREDVGAGFGVCDLQCHLVFPFAFKLIC
jgi:hypothetical protein